MSFLLSKKGIAHKLIAREEKLRPLALGETLPPSALPLLNSLGLLEMFEEGAIKRTTGYLSCWGTDGVTDHNFFSNRPFQYGLKLNKEKLTQLLEEQQKAHIVYFKQSISVAIEGEQEVKVMLDNAEVLNASYLVDATGRKRVLSKELTIPELSFDNLTALTCHLPQMKISGLPHGVYIETFEKGWGIVSALSEAENVMTLYTTKEEVAKSGFADYSNWSEILNNTNHLKLYLSPQTDLKVIGGKANSSRLSSIAGKNWLAIGDAAMAFDPLSSHGITSGVYTASRAVEVIEADLNEKESGAMQAYADQLCAIFNTYQQQKQSLYRQEQSWSESPFWQKMHQID